MTPIDDFGACVGSAFELVFPDAGPVTATLTELTQVHPPEQFSLVFTGPPEAPIRQGICRLDHATLGSLDVFLVPIGRDDGGGLRYEAVFNRRMGP